MSITFLTLIAAGFLSIGSAEVIRTESLSLSRLSQSEARVYESILANKGTLRSRVVSFEAEGLTDGNFELDLFDGMRENYAVSWDSRESRWKGNDGASGRLSIRKVNGRYVGYLIHKGKRYVISPLGDGVSALLEQDPYFECGVRDLGVAHEH